MIGIFLATLLRRSPRKFIWEAHYSWLLGAALIGLFVIAERGTSGSTGLILQYCFLWSLPFVFLFYRPDINTVSLFSKFIFGIFLIDFVFNVGGLALGRDLLGREIDIRQGALASARMGGVFAHSFYSGSISLTALTTLLAGRYSMRWAIFPVLNLLLAGSWRLAVALPVILLFLLWKHRSYAKELLIVLLLSLLAIVITIYSSGVVKGSPMPVNEANTLRLFAWVTAIEKISKSPITGFGYPKVNTLQGVDTDTIDDALAAESWYLGSAITFGIPYTLLRFIGLLMFFYSRRHSSFAKISCPLILVDMTYGNFFEGILFYTLLWIQLSAVAPASQITKARRVRTTRHFPYADGNRSIKIL